ncbi:MAG: hypothetical protein ACLQJ0_04945 [Steroidobacteraceae bacterium]|jgi:hypothetical protein
MKLSQMFDGVKPFDWLMLLVELLVLLLIAYEVVIPAFHRRRTSRRLASLLALMNRGQKIQDAVPASGTTDDLAISAWKTSVEEWLRDTHKTLVAYSPQASTIFLHDTGGTSLRYRGVAQNAHDYFVMLLARMNNLRAIMEKPEVYF